MAGGLPCVGTDSPGIRDVIDSGRTGLLVPPENAAVLAEAIQRLAGDPALRQSLGTAAAREIAEKYSIQRNIAAHEDLYRQVMER